MKHFLQTLLATLTLPLWIICCAVPKSFQPEIVNGGRAMAMAVDPSNEQKLIVASETGGLFRSKDGGKTWKHCSGSTTFRFTDVLYLNSNTVLASANTDMKEESGGGVWRSVDGGVSWEKAALRPSSSTCLKSLAAYSLARASGAGRLWAGTECGLAFSDDDGATWTYIERSTNYSNDKIYSVLAPSDKDLKILTDSGVKVSADTGQTWSVSNTGLPGSIFQEARNQIAVSPFNTSHIFRSLNYWKKISDEEREARNALYFSNDNGKNWSVLRDDNGSTRPTFVQVAKSLAGSANSYDLYYHDGGGTFERVTVIHGDRPVIPSRWRSLNISGDVGGHADLTSMALRNDGKTPYFLTGDGGLHKTEDNGLTWPMTGGGSKGYNALQITEVTGQRQLSGKGHLYFGTQDNHIWASKDNGVTWPTRIGGEGFYLQVPNQYVPEATTQVTGRACVECYNFIAGTGLSNNARFSNAANNEPYAPCLIKPGYYLQPSKVSNEDTTYYKFQLTPDKGSTWRTRFSFPEELNDLPKIAAGGSEPVIYMAIKIPGVTPDGVEKLGIRRVVGLLRNEKPLLSDVSGFGSLGIFPTMFAWYKPFGAYPNDPNTLIVPDIIDDVVKVTRDGGATWKIDTALTRLVTQNGKLLFHSRKRGFTQITSFGFDPDYGGHWLVGTRQAGIMQTFDQGLHWEYVAGTDLLPNISSFYFMGKGDIVVSTYGRGLWKLHIENPKTRRIEPNRYFDLDGPLVYYRGVHIPLKDIINPEACPVCGYYLLESGRVAGFSLESAGAMNQVRLLSGKLQGFNVDGSHRALPFSLQYVKEMDQMGGDAALEAFMKEQKLEVKGFYLEDKQMMGVLLARQDIRPEQLPKRKPLPPRITVTVPGKKTSVVLPVPEVLVTGYGFNPKIPLEIRLNDEFVKPAQAPVFDKNGKFTLRLPISGEPGDYSVWVMQKTPGGTVQDVVSFNLAVEDRAGRK